MSKSKTQEVLDKLNKRSKGSLYFLDENPDIDIKRISTGRYALDVPIGGGMPEGRIIEFYGKESSGKTTATIHTIAAYQKQGHQCAFIDYEHAFDPDYARKLGVDTSKLLFAQPTTAEEGLDIIDELIGTGETKLVVVDSVAAMTPKKELEGQSGDSHVGTHARLMSQAMRKFAGKTNSTKTNIIFINQLREKIGVMFGNPETTTGGNALKFYASIRIEFFKGTKKKDGSDVTGNQGHLKVVKNKTYAPFKRSEYDMEFGVGIPEISDLVNYAVEANVVKKSGSWFSYEDTKLGQGITNVSELLADNPDLVDEIRERTNQIYFPTEEEKEILKEED